MKNIPYNLYIHFEKLSKFFNENNGRKENFLKCGFVSVELSTYLLGGLLKQEDVGKDKIKYTLLGLEKQFQVLNTCDFQSEDKGYNNSYSENIDNLKLLGQEYQDIVNRISTRYFELSNKVKIGLGDQFNDIRRQFNLPELKEKVHSGTEEMDYPDIINILSLDEIAYFNTEDKLFMVVHQISECWFKIGINELKAIGNQIKEPELNADKIGHHFNSVFDTLYYLSDNIMLLENMILSDYHPLRVALRGASGGQSQQAYEIFSISRKLFENYLQIIQEKDITIVQILENPKSEKKLLSVLNNFTKHERALKNFFFQHYVLTSNIIGSESFGSIGHDLVSLVGKFIQPIYKEIDQAKYDLTQKTNFQYGKISGILILDKENFDPNKIGKHTNNTEVLNRVVDEYFRLISKFDKENWIKLFAEDGFIEDPLGSRPYIGHDQLGIFFKGVLRFFSEFNMKIETKQLEQDAVKVNWKTNATSYNGKNLVFNGTEVFKINDKGEIMSAQVLWDPVVIAEQL